MGGSRPGYEHRFRISMREEQVLEQQSLGFRTYILEVRTNFILKPIGPDAQELLVDTETFCDRLVLADYATPDTFASLVSKARACKNMADLHLRGRLSKYRMSDVQIRTLAQFAFDFAHRLAEDPQYDYFRTIPVLVDIDVCTVQLEGEPLDATMDRSVKPEFLIPLQLRWTLTGMKSDLESYLTSLPTVVVREHNDIGEEGFSAEVDSCPICLSAANVCLDQMMFPAEYKYAFHQTHSVSREEGLRLMEVCTVCLEGPVVGAEIASLPCKHAFHDHCVVRWLLKSKSCPVCRMEIGLQNVPPVTSSRPVLLLLA